MIEIAKNTIKEFLRQKIIYIGIGIGIILILSSYIFQTLTINNGNRVIIDFSLSMIEIFGLLITLFLGSYLLFNEFSKKTILLILSKVEHKWHFIIGKFIGFIFIIGFIYIILTTGFIINLIIHKIDFKLYYLGAIFLSYIKILVTLSFVIFFSTFVNPFLALISSLTLYVISHSTPFMIFFISLKEGNKTNILINFIVKAIYYILPNFQDLSMKEYFLSPYLSNYTSSHFLISVICGGILYIIILIGLSCIIFEKKEF